MSRLPMKVDEGTLSNLKMVKQKECFQIGKYVYLKTHIIQVAKSILLNLPTKLRYTAKTS